MGNQVCRGALQRTHPGERRGNPGNVWVWRDVFLNQQLHISFCVCFYFVIQQILNETEIFSKDIQILS